MRRTDPATVTRIRELRELGMPLKDIAAWLGIAPSTAYVWTRDIPPPPRDQWRPATRRTKGSLHTAKLADLDAAESWAAEQLAQLSEDAFFAAGIALYVGEGHKRDGSVGFTNTNPLVVAAFMRWFRAFFAVDEARLRAHLYLHQGLDLDAAIAHWSAVTGIAPSAFGKPYRAVPDPSIRTAKHVNGCLTVRYSCARTHRRVMALCDRLLFSTAVDPA